MKVIFRKIGKYFYIAPILTTLILSFIGSFFIVATLLIISIIQNSSNFLFQDILPGLLIYSLLTLPIVLTIENIILLFIKPKTEEKEKAIKIWEVVAMSIGVTFTLFYVSLVNIVFDD
ncbi:hypothetical protein KQI41_14880 [Tissierella pigra]|uniref:DUF6688 domain-containing protein n=1 Tax=Tissierella pigra TaxID=2607614 RepID=A0A6N7XI54_9FIRM|nr:hypothetical protein [Tissierella pigra]MBU5427672.1 hypothetical protein [Tissierella pigra]MSU00422.1 hypothetical protein [Tissierella pigra]